MDIWLLKTVMFYFQFCPLFFVFCLFIFSSSFSVMSIIDDALYFLLSKAAGALVSPFHDMQICQKL